MIKRLQRRMSMLVIGVLVIVSIGIVLAIYGVNTQNIISQIESALDVLAENHGKRPELPDPGLNGMPPGGSPGEAAGEPGQIPPPKPEQETEDERDKHTPPPKPEGNENLTEGGRTDKYPGQESRSAGEEQRMADPGERRNLPTRSMTGEEVASLSNYYTMVLDEQGTIQTWESDRMDLYSQGILQEFADQVCESGKTAGRIDAQFFRLVNQEENRLLIVLDARLELLAGRRVLRVTALVASLACLTLSLGAWFLIRRMVQPVDEAFRKQQQFVWDASHELKTPMAVISANADLLESEIGENEYLGYIQSEVNRTDSLVKNLLTLARMDRGTDKQEMKEFDLSEALLEVILPFESTVFEAGKILESRIQENVCCSGNAAMLQQLMVILLSNALKYSNEGGSILVTLEKKNRGAEIRVENSGEGIEPEDLERIFDRFYRTDRSRNSETGGEGLGLAIAKSIVEIHHGKIRAESIQGKNTVFIVTLP